MGSSWLVAYMVVALIASTTTSHGMEGSLSLSLSSSSNAFADNFQWFIRAIRKALIAKADQVYGIPVLRNDVPDSERFLMFKLNYGRKAITLAIDVRNVGFVGYSANKISYMLLDAPREAVRADFFPNSTSQVFLDFKSDYDSLEGAAGITRTELRLGYVDYNYAISRLFDYNQEFLPQSILLLTQMLLEPIKFKFIEQSIVNMLRNSYTLVPGLAMLSLENNWVKLSSQIQASVSLLQGVFGTTVDLYDSNDQLIRVDSIHYPIITTNIALMLHRCEADATNTLIRILMPSHDSDSCYVGRLWRSTRITGLEGYCLTTEYRPHLDEIPVTLHPCKDLTIRDWRFQKDGTIQIFGYCLTYNRESSAVVSRCSKDEAISRSAKWKVSMDGTITNLDSGFVLTANASITAGKTELRVEANTKAFGQGWRVGSHLNPITTSIIGLRSGMCLEATNKNTNAWFEKCAKSRKEQSWALYGDGSIRVNNDRSLCVSSPTDGSGGLVSILSCVGSANQRWVFKVDGTIMNPKTDMGLAVDVSLKRLILRPIAGSPEEEWALLY